VGPCGWSETKKYLPVSKKSISGKSIGRRQGKRQ
jgi:hypothetical protein